MKTQDKQILAMLQAFDPAMVLKAFDLYKEGIDNQFESTLEELKDEGWFAVDEKPTDKESYFINGQYWIQSEEKRLENFEKAKKIAVQMAAESKKRKKVSADLFLIDSLKCPKCDSGLYRQKVCPGCKDGKKGYTLRLICEEHPEHEFLI